jgi:hypothetical protein
LPWYRGADNFERRLIVPAAAGVDRLDGAHLLQGMHSLARGFFISADEVADALHANLHAPGMTWSQTQKQEKHL